MPIANGLVSDCRLSLSGRQHVVVERMANYSRGATMSIHMVNTGKFGCLRKIELIYLFCTISKCEKCIFKYDIRWILVEHASVYGDLQLVRPSRW